MQEKNKGYLVNSAINYCRLFKGKRLFKHMIKDVSVWPVFLCPHDGLGDSYEICRYLQYVSTRFTFFVIGNGNFEVCKLFKIPNVKIIKTQEEMDYICYYLNNNPQKNVRILHYDHTNLNSHVNIIANIRGVKDTSYDDMIREVVLGLHIKVRPKDPIFVPELQNVKKIIAQMAYRRSAVIAPLASSMGEIDHKLWGDIVEWFFNHGFKVYTNIVKETDYVLPNTTPLSIPISCLKEVLEYGGCFVGLRSGLCEVISSINCKKVILYPEWWWGTTVAYNYFNMKKMNLCLDALEINLRDTDNSEIVELLDKYING